MNSVSTQLDSIFQAFGHGKRRGMLYTLSFHPATITQLAEEYDLSLPAMHKHIKSLESAKLIHRRKVGRTNFVALNKKSMFMAQDWLMQFRTDWGNEKETLENYITGLQK
jgi:DNA-binding transcriptional ArsR family regulator